MKTFLSIMPLQPKGNLKKTQYQAGTSQALDYGETCFPLIPLINGYTDSGDEIRVIAVLQDYQPCRDNLETFKEEIENLSKVKSFIYKLIPLIIPYDDSVETVLGAYKKFIAYTAEADDLYADITFGSKPLSTALTMALQFAYRTNPNVLIDCVVYGQVDHSVEPPVSRIYDVTALIQLDEIVRLLADSNVSNPAELLSKLIDE